MPSVLRALPKLLPKPLRYCHLRIALALLLALTLLWAQQLGFTHRLNHTELQHSQLRHTELQLTELQRTQLSETLSASSGWITQTTEHSCEAFDHACLAVFSQSLVTPTFLPTLRFPLVPSVVWRNAEQPTPSFFLSRAPPLLLS
jgi:hypothetical protein